MLVCVDIYIFFICIFIYILTYRNREIYMIYRNIYKNILIYIERLINT